MFFHKIQMDKKGEFIMACFVVSAAEAIVTTIVTKIVEKKEKNSSEVNSKELTTESINTQKTPFSRKLKWLRNMLWGGSALLAFEHVWHGEIVPWFPFLTAASNPSDTAEMLHEMATVGVAMAALVTFVWLIMVGVSVILEKKAKKALPVEG